MNIDRIVEVGGVLQRGRKYSGKLLSKSIGGTGANIAIAIARFSREFNVKLIASIGADHADYIISTLRFEGVDVSGISIHEEPSGEAFIVVDRGFEATVVTVPNANLHPPDPGICTAIDRVDAVVLGNTVRETALNLVDVARRRGAAIFLDPGVSWFSAADLINLEGECFIIPNKHEFEELFGVGVDSYLRNPNLISTGCTIVVKLGAGGAIAVDRRASVIVRASPLDIEKLGLEPKTTAGCGDVFTGVFTAKYLESRDLVEALLYASVAAGLKRTRIATSDAPVGSEVERVVEIARMRNLVGVSLQKL